MLRDDLAINEEYKRWLENSTEEMKEELRRFSPSDVQESFAQDLEFGTGGMRGVLGAGTNRMNTFTVRRATLGFGRWISERFSNPSVVIAFDTRRKSAYFAEVAAEVFSSMGIKVHLFIEPMPVPVLSFAVRELKASGGVVITASHNPPQYNGYKVYTSDGTQAVPKYAEEIIEKVEKSDFFENYNPDKTLVEKIPNSLLEKFIETVKKNVLGLCSDYDGLSVVYTPLHGSGNYPVYKTLSDLGHKVKRVEEQTLPDGNFPTVKSPNPEDLNTFSMALSEAEEAEADLLIATDPDCDRLGIMVKHEGNYIALNGNQTGVIMTAFILERLKESLPNNPFIVKTIVSTDLAKKIAAKYNVEVKETLTGFKFIGEIIEKSEVGGNGSYLFGFEESYGSLYGRHARDKDAVSASALACTIGGFLKRSGRTMIDYLEEIYEEHGYYLEALVNKDYVGIEGKERIESIMRKLRSGRSLKFGDEIVIEFRDYLEESGDLPVADVISIEMQDNSKIIVRPSGTEPKMKFYLMVRGDNENEARKRIEELRELVEGIEGL
ncbi:MAG: phospho-sugar mutase [Kosmotogaceae bacterium]|nr:phospho-sugar mutase [Kosmotogaceae bacterium]